MSLGHGASIVRNGLIFQYDMDNDSKSWKGAPTTNVINTDLLSYTNENGCVVTDTGEKLEGNPIIRVVFPSGTLPRIWTTFTYNDAETFTGSIYYRVVQQGSDIVNMYFRELGFGTSYASAAFTSADWVRVNLAHTFTGSGTSMFLLYQSNSSSTAPTTIEFAMPQVEQYSFSTPFVNGTRSNTEAIIDLTQNNTITANSLTYNSDNTFEFDGSNDYISSPPSSNWAFGINGTIEQWVYPTDSTGNNRLWCVNNNASSLDAYLNGSGYALYLHGNTVGTTATLTRNSWNCVCVRYTGGTVSIFYNGVEQPLTGTTTGFNITNSDTLIVGEYRDLSGYKFNGKIPTMRVYNRSLSDFEILQNFEANRGRFGI